MGSSSVFYKTFFAFLIVAFISGFFSCNDDIDYSTNPADKLTFSVDTLRMDTIISGVGSSTFSFKVFNRGAKALMISSIELTSSVYSVVVDGRRMINNSLTDVEIGAKDSLIVFVEANVNATQKSDPVLYDANLVFRFNGNVQQVRLEAYSWDVFVWRGKTIDHDTLISGTKPFLIYDSLVVAKGAVFSVSPGVQLLFHDKAFMRVDGQIQCKGEVNKPVVLRGDRFDLMLPDFPYDLYAGLWQGVNITKDSYDNLFEHTIIRNGDYGIKLDSSDLQNQKVKLVNCKLTNMTGTVFHSTHSRAVAYGCEFSNGGSDVVALYGGDYSFEHCTLMSNYLWSSKNSPSALHLCNYKLAPVAWYWLPLVKADFLSCIIYGRKNLEIFEDKKIDYTGNTKFKYYFNRCLIKAKGEDDDSFVETLWDKKAGFVNAGENYRFDLRLDSVSEAIDQGRLENVANALYDMYGHSRIADGKPDLGAYERVIKK